jgi:GT2 family glycosyltransferase
MSKISVVILTYNSINSIKSCLDSVFAGDYQDFEVIIVDNGSTDGTVDFIKMNYPKVIFIENKNNLGACMARNQGIEATNGDWVLTLDCDIILGKNFLSNIVKETKNLTSEVGIVQPKILKADRKTIYSTGIFLSALRRFYDIGREKKDDLRFDKQRHVFGACSACALYKRQMLEEIKEDTGYFDERFFFLVEDVDLAWRAQRKGWKAKFYPQLICYHGGNSSRFNGELRQYLCFRNRYYLMIKNESAGNFYRNFIFLFPYDFFRFFWLLFTNPYTLKAMEEIYSFRKYGNKHNHTCI